MRQADAQRFRTLLSRFATGVTVATAVDADGQPTGMTASSVASVSLEPPLLLVCVSHGADFYRVITDSQHFALNVLAHDQEHLSRRFADKESSERFKGVRYFRGEGGVPLLNDVVAHIRCTRWSTHDVGDHTIVVGSVTGGEVFDREPLLHFRSHYTTTRD